MGTKRCPGCPMLSARQSICFGSHSTSKGWITICCIWSQTMFLSQSLPYGCSSNYWPYKFNKNTLDLLYHGVLEPGLFPMHTSMKGISKMKQLFRMTPISLKLPYRAGKGMPLRLKILMRRSTEHSNGWVGWGRKSAQFVLSPLEIVLRTYHLRIRTCYLMS